jgi:L-ascorbate metabolism protein UlaG (beta-lactamase superfamily)
MQRSGMWGRALALAVAACGAVLGEGFTMDTISTAAGNIEVTCIGHGTLMFKFGEKVIHVDPWSELADYSTLPKADLILVTHDHRDHLDPKAIEAVRRQDTQVVVSQAVAGKIPGSVVLRNGEAGTFQGIKVEAVPAYNIVNLRAPNQPYHPRGAGNGYVITLGGARVYVAGDTEDVPEVKALRDITCAFLPMNLPYTMTPEMVASAALAIKPKILYPYHFGETDPARLLALLKDSGIEVRIRAMK